MAGSVQEVVDKGGKYPYTVFEVSCQAKGTRDDMNHRQSALLLRAILAILGFVLALESYFLAPRFQLQLSFSSFPDSGYDSSPGWSDHSSSDEYDSGGGWDSGGGSDSSWDGGGGDWDSGGDSGSWDSGGGDSGSW